MSVFQSLICLRGYDNGRRFLLINLVCYLLLLLISPVMSKAMILTVLLLLVATPLVLTSSVRRIHDAGFATPFAIIPVITFWICTLGIALIEHAASYALLVLAVLVTGGMTMVSNARVRRNRNYHLGYDGPVNLQGASAQESAAYYHQRVEPTIASDGQEHLPDESQSTVKDLFSSAGNEKIDDEKINEKQQSGHQQWDNKIADWFESNHLPVMIMGGALALLLVVIAIWPLFSSEPELVEVQVEEKPVEEPKQRIAKVKMPDNFWVMLDQNNAVTIAWQGDLLDDGELWSALTGKGDTDCINLQFSRNDKFRTMRVEVKNQGDYYADFSPVDSQAIITAIAKKSRFYLCGFDFSLKGTQALLQTNKKYSQFLREND